MAAPPTQATRPTVTLPGSRFSLVGPLFYYDLMRLARRGRSILLRVTYASALLVAMFLAYHDRFPTHDLLSSPLAPPRSVPASQLSSLAEAFVFSLLVVQTAAVFILTPAYLAGVIAEEKERGTLELLLTTQLRDHEIVLGKLAARLTHLGGVLLAGLPLLALNQLWGGVDMRLVLAAYFATGLCLLSVGAVSIFASVICKSVLSAVITAYSLSAALFLAGFACPAGGITTPAGLFDALVELFNNSASLPLGAPLFRWPVYEAAFMLAICMLFHGVLALLFGVGAIGSLRLSAGVATARPVPVAAPPPAGVVAEWGPFDLSVPPPSARGNLPPIGDWPLLWKETLPAVRGEAATPMFERALRQNWFGMAVLLAVPIVLILLARRHTGYRPEEVKSLGILLRMMVLVAAGAWCAVLAFRSAAGIIRERDKGTLEGLLMLPVSRAEVLGAKWAGAILFARGFGYALAAVLIVGLLSGMLHPIGVALLTMAVAAHVAFLASVGVFLSSASRTTLWARVTMALVLLAFLGLSFRALLPEVRLGVAGYNLTPVHSPAPWRVLPWKQYLTDDAVNAPGAWWFLACSRDEYSAALAAGDSQFVGRLIAAECGIVGYALVARLLWTLAWLRLGSERRP
jgi:ABC-type transport system involved in multi-copper enzyme maturation permease subunit